MKGYRDMKRREKRECSFSDLADYQQERFGECDKYASDYTVFNVLGIEVWVENDKLSEALKTLTEKSEISFCYLTSWIWQTEKSAVLSIFLVQTSSITEQRRLKH